MTMPQTITEKSHPKNLFKIFHDLGSDYYDSFNRDRKINSYLKRLKALGWEPDAIPSSA